MADVATQALMLSMLDELGLRVDLTDFDSRLKLQKAVYLLKGMGAPLPYSYNWYLRGPYSPSLTEDLFYLDSLETSVRAKSPTILGGGAKARLAELKHALKRCPPTLNETRWYEALASALYLKSHGFNQRDIKSRLSLEKKMPYSVTDDALAALASLSL